MLTTLFYSLFALDQTLANMAGQYGAWIYALLFVVIFAETGLVVFPFLPGDSILFISGTVVATAGLDVHLLVGLLIVAAILGDSLNYAIGHYIGPRVYERPDSRWFKQAHLRKTQAFYDKYGGVTIIIGGSFRSSARSRRSWPAWLACPIAGSSRTTSSAACCGSACWSTRATCSAISRGSSRTCR